VAPFNVLVAEGWCRETKQRKLQRDFPSWIMVWRKSFDRKAHTLPFHLTRNTTVFHAQFIAAS
jgi:hypothetical protein